MKEKYIISLYQVLAISFLINITTAFQQNEIIIQLAIIFLFVFSIILSTKTVKLIDDNLIEQNEKISNSEKLTATEIHSVRLSIINKDKKNINNKSLISFSCLVAGIILFFINVFLCDSERNEQKYIEKLENGINTIIYEQNINLENYLQSRDSILLSKTSQIKKFNKQKMILQEEVDSLKQVLKSK
jgi:Na+/H+-translocating membrane pyrophosphatase